MILTRKFALGILTLSYSYSFLSLVPSPFPFSSSSPVPRPFERCERATFQRWGADVNEIDFHLLCAVMSQFAGFSLIYMVVYGRINTTLFADGGLGFGFLEYLCFCDLRAHVVVLFLVLFIQLFQSFFTHS